MSHTAREAIQIVEHATAVVITVYRRDPTQTALTMPTCWMTRRGMYVREVSDPKAVCLSVDGPGIGVGVAEDVSERYGTSLVVAERNGGKFAAVQHGVLHMLQESAPTATSPRWTRTATTSPMTCSISCAAPSTCGPTTGADRILVMGERTSLHRPLGYLRGEQETLADAMLLDALTIMRQCAADRSTLRSPRSAASLSRLPRRVQTVQPRQCAGCIRHAARIGGLHGRRLLPPRHRSRDGGGSARTRRDTRLPQPPHVR